MCRRNPGVVIVAVAGLGVAIGFSTSIFSIVNGVVFKPSGIDEPSSVVRIFRGSEGGLLVHLAVLGVRALQECLACGRHGRLAQGTAGVLRPGRRGAGASHQRTVRDRWIPACADDPRDRRTAAHEG